MKWLLCVAYFVLVALLRVSGFVLADFRYVDHRASNQRFDLYLDSYPNTMTTEDIIRLTRAAMDTWNAVPHNKLVLGLDSIYPPGVQCPHHHHDAANGFICFRRIHSQIPARCRWRGMVLDLRGRPNHPWGTNLMFSPDFMFNKYTFYNIMMHELGHVNLIEHSQYLGTIMRHMVMYVVSVGKYLPDSEYIAVSNDDANAISMLYTGKLYDAHGIPHDAVEDDDPTSTHQYLQYQSSTHMQSSGGIIAQPRQIIRYKPQRRRLPRYLQEESDRAHRVVQRPPDRARVG